MLENFLISSFISIIARYIPSFKKKETAIEIKPISFDSIKKIGKIVVIDDDINSFPINEFKDFGYNIDLYTQVDHHLLKRLKNGEYDVIVLDINGIAQKSISIDDGFGILINIKEHHPHQVIIAFSGATYDIEKNDFFNKADFFMRKPIDLIKAEEKIDLAMHKAINLQYYLDDLKYLSHNKGFSENEIKKITNVIDKYTLKPTPKSYEDFYKHLKGISDLTTIAEKMKKILDLSE